ncbi:jg7530, partial [Pararge aegeria aegeria]
TNIFQALEQAINLIQMPAHQQNQTESTNSTSMVDCLNGTETKKDELEPMIIFLTDGEPTVGEINTDHIITYLTEKNIGEKRAPLFSLAFGKTKCN